MDDRIVGDPVNRAAAIVFLIFGLFILLSGIVGNGFLLFVLGTQRKLWEVHNIFIANLALADLVVVCSGLTFLLLDLLLGYHPVVSEFHCEVNGFILCLAYSVSILSLVSISFNRYMKVCHTSRFHALFSLRKNALYCVGLWVIGCLLQTPLLAGYPAYGYDAGSHCCQARAVRNEINYGGMAMSVLLAGPVALIGFFNYAIFHKWSESRSKFKGNETKAADGTELKPRPVGKLRSVFYVEYSSTSDMSSDMPRSVNVTNTTSVDADVNEGAINGTDTDPDVQIHKETDTNEKKALVSMCAGAGPKGQLSHTSDRGKYNHGETSHDILPSVITDSGVTGHISGAPPRQIRKNSLQARKHTLTLTRNQSLPMLKNLDSSLQTRKYSPVQGRKFGSPAQTRKNLYKQSNPLAPKYLPDDRNDITPVCSVSNLPAADTSTDKIIFDSDQDSKPKTSPLSKSETKGDQKQKKKKKKIRLTGATRAEVALVRSLLVISICLLALYTPFAACLLADYGTDLPSELMVFASLLLFVNCAINWVIYGVMNTSFRQGYARALRRLKCSCFGRSETEK